MLVPTHERKQNANNTQMHTLGSTSSFTRTLIEETIDMILVLTKGLIVLIMEFHLFLFSIMMMDLSLNYG